MGNVGVVVVVGGGGVKCAALETKLFTVLNFSQDYPRDDNLPIIRFFQEIT